MFKYLFTTELMHCLLVSLAVTFSYCFMIIQWFFFNSNRNAIFFNLSNMQFLCHIKFNHLIYHKINLNLFTYFSPHFMCIAYILMYNNLISNNSTTIFHDLFLIILNFSPFSINECGYEHSITYQNVCESMHTRMCVKKINQFAKMRNDL